VNEISPPVADTLYLYFVWSHFISSILQPDDGRLGGRNM